MHGMSYADSFMWSIWIHLYRGRGLGKDGITMPLAVTLGLK